MSNQNDNKHKHLEFIQITITRMNVNSFLVKGWVVTLVAAIFVLSAKDANTEFLWITPFIGILYWALDAYYLSNERKYRDLYNDVRILDDSAINYSMDLSAYEGGKNSFFMCLVSATLLLFYPSIVIASIIASALINK